MGRSENDKWRELSNWDETAIVFIFDLNYWSIKTKKENVISLCLFANCLFNKLSFWRKPKNPLQFGIFILNMVNEMSIRIQPNSRIERSLATWDRKRINAHIQEISWVNSFYIFKRTKEKENKTMFTESRLLAACCAHSAHKTILSPVGARSCSRKSIPHEIKPLTLKRHKSVTITYNTQYSPRKNNFVYDYHPNQI